MHLRRWRALALCLTAGALALGLLICYPAQSSNEPPAAAAQDVITLDRRLSLLEQRLYTIEASMRQLENQVRLANSPPPAALSARDTELTQLRTEVAELQRRLVEVECGLVRLDERTLSQAARTARREETANRVDPCRLNAQTPLRLSTHP